MPGSVGLMVRVRDVMYVMVRAGVATLRVYTE